MKARRIEVAAVMLLAACVFSAAAIASPDGVLTALAASAALLLLTYLVVTGRDSLIKGVGLGGAITILCSPSLPASFVSWMAAYPAAAIIVWTLASRTRHNAITKRDIAWLCLIIFAEIVPALVYRHSDFQVLSISAVTAALIAMAGLLIGMDSRARTGLTTAIITIATFEVLAFLLAALTDFHTIFALIPSSGTRVGWYYGVGDIGAVWGVGAGFTNVISPRLTGWMAEPGAYAAVVVVAASFFFQSHRMRWIAHTVAILTCVLSQSLAGALTYAAGIAAYLLSSQSGTATIRRWQRLLATILLLGAIAVLISTPELILGSKSSSNTGSVDDRFGGIGGIGSILHEWFANPLGTGVAGANSEINLLQSSVTNGPIIFIAFGLVTVWPMFSRPRSTHAVVIVTMIAVTIIFAQPPFYEIWVFLLGLEIGRSKCRPDDSPLAQGAEYGVERIR